MGKIEEDNEDLIEIEPDDGNEIEREIAEDEERTTPIVPTRKNDLKTIKKALKKKYKE